MSAAQRKAKGDGRKGVTADGRTTLGKAMGEDIRARAASRLAGRRGALGTPAISLTKGKGDATDTKKGDKAKKGEKGEKVSLTKERISLRKAASQDIGGRAEERFKERRAKPGPPPFGRDPKGGERREEKEKKRQQREEKKKEKETGAEEAAATAAEGAADQGEEDWEEPYEWWRDVPPHGGWDTPPPSGSGRGPGDIPDPVDVTVTRADRPAKTPSAPAGLTTGVRGLPRVPHRGPHTRPGTTAPAPAGGGPRLTKETTRMAARPAVRLPGAGRQMAAEHETEVTLDDVLDGLTQSKDNCLTTYDECAELAVKATRLRDALVELSDDLAERHNIIGRMTSAAMERMAESMDVLAAQAQAMRTRSLAAAEELESAHDGMHDAYRPVQQATADAGLATPSARAHNED